jgi:hypothetical protein
MKITVSDFRGKTEMTISDFIENSHGYGPLEPTTEERLNGLAKAFGALVESLILSGRLKPYEIYNLAGDGLIGHMIEIKKEE